MFVGSHMSNGILYAIGCEIGAAISWTGTIATIGTIELLRVATTCCL